MLECWNAGIMGEGGQDHKVKEEKRDDCLLAKLLLTGKLINEKLLLKPIFHYSIIPSARQGLKPQKIPLFSISCRISETFN